MRLFHKNSRFYLILTVILISVTMLGYSATPEKPYPALEEGDRLNAYWLMGMFNVIYDWAQTTNSSLSSHAAATEAHGVSGAIVGTTNTQTLTNKTISSGSTWSGNAIPVANGGTGASTAASARANIEAVGVSDTQTLANKTLSGGSTWAGNAIPVTNGGTGASTAEGARANIGVSYGSTAGTVAEGNDTRFGQVKTTAPTTPVNGDIWVE